MSKLVLRIVEVKDKDLYTVYDVEKGGVCCCSKYTLMQLRDVYGVKIEGLVVGKRNIEIQELGLDGKVRTKKAPVICEDTTKRSATTILKGLDEKHYPRVKANRRGTGSLVKLSYVSRVSKQQVTGALAIQNDNAMFLLEDMSCVYRDKHPEMKIENYEGTREELDYMLYVMRMYAEKMKMRAEIIKSREEIQQKIEKMNKQLEELTKVMEKRERDIKDEVCQVYISRKYSYLTGDELAYHTFTGKGPDLKDGEIYLPGEALSIFIRKSKRKILYTHGLSYRGPTTHNVPITKEKALEIIKKYGWCDLDARNKDYIHLNTYSENDMW